MINFLLLPLLLAVSPTFATMVRTAPHLRTTSMPGTLSSLRLAGGDGVQALQGMSLSNAWSANGHMFDGLTAHRALPVMPMAAAPKIRSASHVFSQAHIPSTPHFEPPALPGRTPLEKHAAFFDINGDGIVTVGETRRRLMQLGLGNVRASATAVIIHAGLTMQTRATWKDAARLHIRVANIQKGIHTGDTGVYDRDGQFNAAAFERMFSQFAKSDPNRLNEDELIAMRTANAERRPGLLGRLGAKAEFDLLLDIAADGSEIIGGRTLRTLSRGQLRAFYDGSLLYRLVGERAS
jgi:peroxygenase